jgi:hypothetical protein
MTPTTRFRYVEREVRVYICDGIARVEQHKILQQWWEDHNVILAVLRFGSNGLPKNEYAGEWRDIPLEVEA